MISTTDQRTKDRAEFKKYLDILYGDDPAPFSKMTEMKRKDPEQYERFKSRSDLVNEWANGQIPRPTITPENFEEIERQAEPIMLLHG